MPEWVHPAWRRILAPLLSTFLLLSIASFIALTATVGTQAFPGDTPLARACGLANTPTMIANNSPAIPTPVTPTSDPNQPVGFFPGAYYRTQSINFTEDLSAVPNAPPENTLTLRWDFGDGSAPILGTEPKHTYQRTGSFAIRVSTYDSVSGSWVDFDSATITLLSQPYTNPPVAKASANTTLIAINKAVTFTATGSKPLVGSTLSYDWNFGDATPDGIGQHVTHVFTIPGRALVTLIVTDSRGAFSTAVTPITVVVSIPQVHLQVSATTARPGQTITFDASQVQVAAGDKITQYTWDFGDQSPKQTTTASTITHRYTKSGSYRVQVQALDLQNIPGTAITTITIQSGSSSSPPFTLIGLGLLIVLAIGALFFSAIRRRRPAPALQGRKISSRIGAQNLNNVRNNPAARRSPPGRPLTNQTRGAAPGQTRPSRPTSPGGAVSHPPIKPLSQRSERPFSDRNDGSDRFLRE